MLISLMFFLLLPYPSCFLAIILFQGANFRDLKGVQVGENNTVEFNPHIPRVFLPSGKPLVLESFVE